jgi:PAS domain S-box-containing protein
VRRRPGARRRAADSAGQPLRVLYVEHDQADVELALAALEQGGFTVAADVVERPEELTARLRSASYDLVLSDYQLPSWTGMDALELMRREGVELPFILVSGTLGEEAAVECIKQGAADCVLKQSMVRLPLAVRRALAEKDARAARARAEETLRESEDRYRNLIENSQELIQSVAPDGTFVFVNRAWHETLGYTASELPRLSMLDVIHPDSREHCSEVFRRVLRGEVVADVEATFVSKDGRNVQVEGSTAPRIYEGRVVATHGFFRDVTLRKRAEEELKAIEERFKQFVEGSPDAIAGVDGSGRIVLANAQMERLFGYSRRELMGHTVELLVPERLRDAHREHRAAYHRKPVTRPMGGGLDLAGRRKDGTEFPAEISLSPVETRQGLLVMAVVRDLTERKRSEQALRESEQRYRSLFEGMTHGVYRSTADGRFLDVNPALVAMLGYGPKEEVLALDLARDVYARPEDRERLVAQYLQASRVEATEVQWKRRDGAIIDVRLTGRPVHRADGSLEAFEMIAEDVTHRRALELQVQQAQKMDAVGRLAGGVAHDFNNLLTVITGFTDLVMDSLGKGHPAMEDLGEVRRAADRARSLTRQLLAFSRRQVLQPRVLDLNEIVAGMEKMLQRIIGEDVELRSLFSAQGRVRADPGQLEQVVVNLAVNARDAMPRGGRLTIETADVEIDQAFARLHPPTTPGSYVLLAVHDTGVGMDEETLSHIFEPFFTTKEVGQGTGLGLATVYGIVNQSGGYIWAYSEPGRGSTFRVYLPRVEETAEHPVPGPDVAAPRGGTETILLVEDDANVRKIARQILERLGYNVLQADRPDAAVRVARVHQGPIHLLLTDVVMPGGTGAEVHETIQRSRPGIPVLYVSGYAGDAVLRQELGEPGTPFLPKPFTAADLARKVREVLTGGSSAEEPVKGS